MPKKWICLVCDELNEPSVVCVRCGRTRLNHGADACRVVNDRKEIWVVDPGTARSGSRSNEFYRFNSIVSCTNCGKKVWAGSKACLHCFHFFSDEEIESHYKRKAEQFTPMHVWIAFSGLVLVALIILFGYIAP